MGERVVAGLVSGAWRDLDFEPFRDRVRVHWIEKGGDGAPSVALLAYEPGASVPRHHHQGLETILVLEGSQSDESGTYAAGSLVLNRAGTEHSVWSDEGCVVLIQWDLPVAVIGADR